MSPVHINVCLSCRELRAENERLRAVIDMHETIGELVYKSRVFDGDDIGKLVDFLATFYPPIIVRPEAFKAALKALDEKGKEVSGLRAQLAERRTAIEQMLTDTFKETMKIYGDAGGNMGDALADKMALRLGQFTKDAVKFLKKDVKKFLKATVPKEVG